jgi:Grx4 family monothiol glutaredoxin
VSAVPHFLIMKDGKVAAAVEGADPAALTSAVTAHLGGSSHLPVGGALPVPNGQLHPTPPSSRQPPPEAQGPIVQQNGVAATAAGSKAALTERIEALLKSAPILLFMKGSPDAPRCGFSAQVVQALRAAGADFRHFDILQDPAVRDGLKEHSNWPTYPQLYVNGELLGGCDIVLEMAADGELKETLATAAPQQSDSSSLQQRLKQLTTKAPVMLFIKGSRQQPFCRFSKTAVAAVQKTGVPFETFDIFTDDEIREGLKEYSNWPTFPQLYFRGDLVGGADIIAELDESGELAETLNGE